ncbi:hypothetical protein BM1_04012 [Bipolaris maydis]|nr:hypothetical protein BM1_04012 [Bipolaris maydis]
MHASCRQPASAAGVGSDWLGAGHVPAWMHTQPSRHWGSRVVACAGVASKNSTRWAGFGVSELGTGGAAVLTSLSLRSLATAGARASAFVTTAAADCPDDVHAICLASALSALSSPSSPSSPSSRSACSAVVSSSVAGAC